jgi:hypothetical protein
MMLYAPGCYNRQLLCTTLNFSRPIFREDCVARCICILFSYLELLCNTHKLCRDSLGREWSLISNTGSLIGAQGAYQARTKSYPSPASCAIYNEPPAKMRCWISLASVHHRLVRETYRSLHLCWPCLRIIIHCPAFDRLFVALRHRVDRRQRSRRGGL